MKKHLVLICLVSMSTWTTLLSTYDIHNHNMKYAFIDTTFIVGIIVCVALFIKQRIAAKALPAIPTISCGTFTAEARNANPDTIASLRTRIAELERDNLDLHQHIHKLRTTLLDRQRLVHNGQHHQWINMDECENELCVEAMALVNRFQS